MPDGKDARMHSMQVSQRHTPANCRIVKSHGEQLPAAYDPVLPRRDAGEPALGTCAANLSPSDRFMPHTPMVAGIVLREGNLRDGLVPG
jgi:hypothetical protein